MAWTPFTRANHDRSRLRYASDTTYEEWSVIEPLMPPQPSRGRKRQTDLRAVVDAVFYLLQSGCQWGLLPKDFPPKSTVHYYFKLFREKKNDEIIEFFNKLNLNILICQE